MREDEIPIETFNAMLRDLLTWRLVVEGDGDDAGTGNGSSSAGPTTPGELSIVRGPWPTERTAYPSRRCAECHQETIDLVARRFVCVRSVLATATGASRRVRSLWRPPRPPLGLHVGCA